MKLQKLPDRTPVKLSVVISPQLAVRLREYSEFYAETYGVREEPADLIPFILDAFMESDVEFRRTRRISQRRRLGIVSLPQRGPDEGQ